MNKIINGVVVEMTSEEAARFIVEQSAPITTQERIAQIKQTLCNLDLYVPRSVEELYTATPDCGLSQYNIQRISQKLSLRQELASLAA